MMFHSTLDLFVSKIKLIYYLKKEKDIYKNIYEIFFSTNCTEVKKINLPVINQIVRNYKK